MSQQTVDILSIDTIIKSEFEEEAKNIKMYREKYKDLQKTISKEILSSRSYRNLKKNIERNKINK